MPVTVLGQQTLRQLGANSVADAFRDVQGLDVTGVGTSQVRPIIRGQRGQRILVLGDGLRLNNARRQQDFGEIPALFDISSIERVEIVRGPGSVLYGSDAIGGVVNLVTIAPDQEGLHGSVGYQYSTHDKQQNVRGMLEGVFGRLSFRARGTFRNTDAYLAPSGDFGNITLATPTRVHDTGVRDYSGEAFLGYNIAQGHHLSLKFQRYSADSAGFGFVDPAAYAPESPDIMIQYPRQRFDRLSAKYEAVAVPLVVADMMDLNGYWQGNVRNLSIDVLVPIGAPGPDSVLSAQRNFTDIETLGGRLELKKFVGRKLTVTYGADYFRDRSENTDTSFAATFFPFGTFVDTSTVSSVPNSTFQSLGLFGQGEVEITPRARVVLGARYQSTRAETHPVTDAPQSPHSASDRALVGSLNAIVEAVPGFNLVGTVGRGFRSPNLIERFFEGVTPEGFGYQVTNTDLKPETSLNVDLGARLNRGIISADAFVFQNTVYDAIRIEETGEVDSSSNLPKYQNVNIDRLRVRGVELRLDVHLPYGFDVGGNFTHLKSRNVAQDQNNPTGDGFSSQLFGSLRYVGWDGRFFGEYRIRHNFERDDPELMPGNPVGTVLPAFTTQSIHAGIMIAQRAGLTHRLTVGVTNLGNALYAEFANVGFFRPNPERSFMLTYDLVF
jgi:hemoglobin/transferrin/lactoferrin receptor protein